MRTLKLRKIGNAVGLTLPQAMLRTAGLAEGDEIEVVATVGEVRICKAGKRVTLTVTQEDLKLLRAGVVPPRLLATSRKRRKCETPKD